MRCINTLAPVLAALLLDVLLHLDEFKDTVRDIDALEFMSGQAEISKAAARVGLVSYGYDRSYSTCDINNINTAVGFKRAMQLTMRVKRHGAIWMAPVCSSWIWLSRSGSGRTREAAHGNTAVSWVRSGNRMVVRLVLVMIVAWIRGCHLFLENPMTTVVNFFSPMREAIQCLLNFKVTLPLSAYGSSSHKFITIWSTTPLVQQLYRKKGVAAETLATNKDGCITGKHKALKTSQAYPPAFGAAVAQIYMTLARDQNVNDLLDEDALSLLVGAMSPKLNKRKRLCSATIVACPGKSMQT